MLKEADKEEDMRENGNDAVSYAVEAGVPKSRGEAMNFI